MHKLVNRVSTRLYQALGHRPSRPASMWLSHTAFFVPLTLLPIFLPVNLLFSYLNSVDNQGHCCGSATRADHPKCHALEWEWQACHLNPHQAELCAQFGSGRAIPFSLSFEWLQIAAARSSWKWHDDTPVSSHHYQTTSRYCTVCLALVTGGPEPSTASSTYCSAWCIRRGCCASILRMENSSSSFSHL